MSKPLVKVTEVYGQCGRFIGIELDVIGDDTPYLIYADQDWLSGLRCNGPFVVGLNPETKSGYEQHTRRVVYERPHNSTEGSTP